MSTSVADDPLAAGGIAAALPPHWARLGEGLLPTRGSAGKLGTQVAERIFAQLLDEEPAPGASLGTEAELIVRHGVSRATLRQAIRQLEAHGAIRMRRGNPGGLFVEDSADRATARIMATYLTLIGAGPDELLELAAILMAAVSSGAAACDDEDQVQALIRLRSSLADPDTPAKARASRWGEAMSLILTMSGNPALRMFLRALALAHPGVDVAARAPGGQAEAARLAVELAGAVVARDAAAATSAAQRMAPYFPLLAQARRRDSPAPGRSGTAKRNQTLAVAIARQVLDGGMPPGAKLGTEADLLAAHRVGRSVLREALSILELHGIVETRSGQRGGVVAGHPDPSYTVRRTVAYLDRLHVDAAHLSAVHMACGTAAGALAARNGSDAQRRLLREILETEQQQGPLRTQVAALIHLQIADMTGNRAIGLFQRVLSAGVIQQPAGTLPEAAWAAVCVSHRRLVEAVVAGDAMLARRRMVEHLRQASGWYRLVRPAAASRAG